MPHIQLKNVHRRPTARHNEARTAPASPDARVHGHVGLHRERRLAHVAHVRPATADSTTTAAAAHPVPAERAVLRRDEAAAAAARAAVPPLAHVAHQRELQLDGVVAGTL